MGKPENLWFPLKSVDGGEILHQAGKKHGIPMKHGKSWDYNGTIYLPGFPDFVTIHSRAPLYLPWLINVDHHVPYYPLVN